MKIYLNLLPDSKKEAIKRKKRIRNIIKQELLFLFPVVIFIVILISINFIMRMEISSMGNAYAVLNSQNKSQDLQKYETVFNGINSVTANINNLQGKHLYWSKVLDVLSGIVPDGVYLSNISTKNLQIFLVGRAKERESLIQFQEMISKSDCFENVNVPLSNFVSKTDIDFQMDFYVKKDCLINKIQ